MNEELKTLMALMNGEIDPTQALAGTLPEEEQSASLEQQATLNPDFGESQEIEITEEMKANNPVVNNARGRNRISGVSDFLANPEVQNALLQFGRAFSEAGNYTGVPGVGSQLADAGENVIQGQANQRALEAFERGEDPAQAAGRFADPNLVQNLQQRQQQQQQFEEQMELERERFGLEEETLRRNSIFRAAKFAQNEELAQAEMENMKRQTEIDQQIADARQAYWEAIANREQGADSENLALRTNEYLQVLNEKTQLTEDRLSNTVNALEDLGVQISDQQLQQLQNGVIGIEDIDISEADASWWWWSGGEEGRRLAQNLLSELGTQVKALQTERAQRRALEGAQTERLTGRGEEEIEQEREEMIPGRTAENPLPVASPQQMRNKNPGTFVDYGGVTYEILEGGNIRRVN